MTDILGAMVYSFSALFVILDPLLSVPLFTSMTQGQSSSEINRQALIAVAVAGFLMYLFLFFNFFIFDTLGITLSSFQVAGGILLFLLGLQMALGIDIGPDKRTYPHCGRGDYWDPSPVRPRYDHNGTPSRRSKWYFYYSSSNSTRSCRHLDCTPVLVPDTEDAW